MDPPPLPPTTTARRRLVVSRRRLRRRLLFRASISKAAVVVVAASTTVAAAAAAPAYVPPSPVVRLCPLGSSGARRRRISDGTDDRRPLAASSAVSDDDGDEVPGGTTAARSGGRRSATEEADDSDGDDGSKSIEEARTTTDRGGGVVVVRDVLELLRSRCGDGDGVGEEEEDPSADGATRRRATTMAGTKKSASSSEGGGGVGRGGGGPVPKEWIKARNYLYRSSSRGDDPNRLTLDRVAAVLDFLDEAFPDDPNLVRCVVQTCPRILKKNVESYLKPTVEFLKDLYGPDLFYQAARRNPGLLLMSGVGYDKKSINNGSDSGDGDGDDFETYARNELRLDDKSISKMKRSSPTTFQLPSSKAESVVAYLESLLEDSCTRSREEVRRIVSKVVAANPRLLALSVTDNVAPRVNFLKEKCGLNRRDVSNVVKTAPAVLGLSVEENLRPTIDFLSGVLLSGRGREGEPGEDNSTEASGVDNNVDEAGRTRSLLRKCVAAHPQLLALSLDNLKAKVDYFDNIDRRSPSPSSTAAARRRRPSSSSLAARVLSNAPSTYSLSLRDNLVPKVEFLARAWGVAVPRPEPKLSSGGGSGDDDGGGDGSDRANSRSADSNDDVDIDGPGDGVSLAGLLSEYPNVLTLSLEGNIQPTIGFYNRTGYVRLDDDGTRRRRRSDDEDGEEESRSSSVASATEEDETAVAVVRGRYVAASLFHRLLPRWHYIMERGGAEGTDDERPSPLDDGRTLPPLHLIAGSTDATFCQRMGIDPDAYAEFKAESVPRLKFKSQFETWLKTGRPIDGV